MPFLRTLLLIYCSLFAIGSSLVAHEEDCIEIDECWNFDWSNWGSRFLEGSMSWGVDLPIHSRYLWRGLALSHRNPVFQPDIWLGYGQLKLTLWSNFDLKRWTFDQVNLIADYTGYIYRFCYSLGVTHYSYFHQGHYSPSFAACTHCSCGNSCNNFTPEFVTEFTQCGTPLPTTTELYFGIGFKAWLEPTLTLFYDVQAIHGWALTLGLSHTFDDALFLFCRYPVDAVLAGAISYRSKDYNKVYYCACSDGFTDAELSLSFPYQKIFCYKNTVMTLTPYICGTTLVDSEIRRGSPHNKVNFAYGLNLSLQW